MRYWYLQNWECSAASFHMIFLHSGIFVDFFAIFTCHALVGYRTQLNSFLSNVAFNGLANSTDLNSVCAVNCEIYVKNIQIYIHTWPKPVFHRLLDFGFAPSARSLRLNKSRTSSWWLLHKRGSCRSQRLWNFVDETTSQVAMVQCLHWRTQSGTFGGVKCQNCSFLPCTQYCHRFNVNS